MNHSPNKRAGSTVPASPTMTTTTRTKRPYTRPCDACASRRIRCDRELRQKQNGTNTPQSCSNCQLHGIQCTNNRVRMKSGPKKIHSKTRDTIRSLVEGSVGTLETLAESPSPLNTSHVNAHGAVPTCEMNPITLGELRPYLEVYRSRYYGIWPVLSVDQCLRTLGTGCFYVGDAEFLVLDRTIAPTYALCCSLCAVVARHTMFWTLEEFESVSHLGLKKSPNPERYALEAERVMYDYNLDGSPTVDLVLCDFFLHVYFSSLERGNSKELVYLRRSISCAQLLCLFDRTTLFDRPHLDAHRIKKIYYLLLITERYVSFKTRLPVMLDPTMPLPEMEDDEYPQALRGFIELAQVFSSADNDFFNEISMASRSRRSSQPLFPNIIANIDSFFNLEFLDSSISHSTSSSALKRDWIKAVQSKLDRSQIQVEDGSQRLNILISRAWLQSIAWSLSNDQLLLTPAGNGNNTNTNHNNHSSIAKGNSDYFDIRYPLTIAQDFLNQSNDIHNDAFESNGPGAVLKLLELAIALRSYIQISPQTDMNFYDANELMNTSFAFDQLAHVHGMILRYRSDIEMPESFHHITDLLEYKKFGFRHMGSVNNIASSVSSYNSSRFEEIEDEEGGDNVNELRQTRETTTSTQLIPRSNEANGFITGTLIHMSSPDEQMGLTPLLKELELPTNFV